MTFPWQFTSTDTKDLAAAIRARLHEIDRVLRTTGAVLFRGFHVPDETAFRLAVVQLLDELMTYEQGASPRTALGKGVYTSTEYDPRQAIPLHNELSYSTTWPTRLAFCCLEPPTSQGATPIADSRKILRRLTGASDLPDSVVYLRTMTKNVGAGVSWPEVFGTDDRYAVESYCAKNGIEWEWQAEGVLRTRQHRPIAIEHPLTGECVWFNQAHLWHPSNLGEDTASVLRSLYGEHLPMDVKASTGEDLHESTLVGIRDALSAETVRFDWRRGDVLVLDNILSAHGREPFTGPRKIVVAMGRAMSSSQVRAVSAREVRGGTW